MHRAYLLVLLALPAAWGCAQTYTHRRGLAEVGPQRELELFSPAGLAIRPGTVTKGNRRVLA